MGLREPLGRCCSLGPMLPSLTAGALGAVCPRTSVYLPFLWLLAQKHIKRVSLMEAPWGFPPGCLAFGVFQNLLLMGIGHLAGGPARTEVDLPAVSPSPGPLCARTWEIEGAAGWGPRSGRLAWNGVVGLFHFVFAAPPGGGVLPAPRTHLG